MRVKLTLDPTMPDDVRAWLLDQLHAAERDCYVVDGPLALADLMDTDPPVVTPTVDQESVAWAMVRKNESSVAVVSGDGEFVGLVPPHRIVGILLGEHDETGSRQEELPRTGASICALDESCSVWAALDCVT